MPSTSKTLSSRSAFSRKTEQIAREAELDGIYILRTSLSDAACAADDVVRSYKQLSRVERAFRTLKGVDLQIRRIFHRLEKRVRAAIFLAMLAYYVEWHLREAWASLLFKDEQPPATSDPVSKALPSEGAQRKASRQTTTGGSIVHSFKSLLSELATRARTTTRIGKTDVTLAAGRGDTDRRGRFETRAAAPRRSVDTKHSGKNCENH